MAETGHVMDKSILRDLKLAIRIRSRVAKSVYGGGDAGHRHFLDVLTYCWCVLNSLPKTASVKDDSQPQPDEQEDANHFSALMVEDDDDEDEVEDEEIFPSTPVPRPSQSEPELLTLDELMNSDDRHDAIVFLLSLDEMMAAIGKHFQSVLSCTRMFRRQGIPETAIVEKLMEVAVVTNMAIEQVQRLEMDLMMQQEHLTTPYRLLATVVFPEVTQKLTATVREHSTNGGCTEKDIIMYLGDCMESYFRNKNDPFNRKNDIVKEFSNKFEVDPVGIKELEQYHMMLEVYVMHEVALFSEQQNYDRIPAIADSHDWIHNMPSIGGNRAIHHTLRLLQTFGDIVRKTPKDRGITAVRGTFGRSPWIPGRSRKIRDLDELLMADILPQWTIMCRKGIIGLEKLPCENEICPLFVLLRKYIEEPHKPVSWSIAFAVHALLTSVLEVDPIVNSLASVSKTVFENYFDQLKWAMNLAENNAESIGDPRSVGGQSWWPNMFTVTFLENLGLPVFGDRLLWNPLCAGTILSYLNYFGNLEGGCAMIDCHAQLRITLHLYHALLANDILRRGQIPFLDILYKAFRNSKAIWRSRHLPERGEFVHRFWICIGCNVADARKLSDEAKRMIRQNQQLTDNRQVPNGGIRKLVPVEPAEISKSYRRICNRDFHDVVDKYHTPEQRSRAKGTDFYRLMVHTNDTLDAIEDEQTLLSLNLPSCSAVVEQFVNSIGRILQWEPFLIESALRIEGGDQRQGFFYLFAQFLLGALDFADDPSSYNFLQVPLGTASSHFMAMYFGRLSIEKVRWFQATQEEE